MLMPREREPLFKIKVVREDDKEETFEDPNIQGVINNPKEIMVIVEEKEIIEGLKISLKKVMSELKNLKNKRPLIKIN